MIFELSLKLLFFLIKSKQEKSTLFVKYCLFFRMNVKYIDWKIGKTEIGRNKNYTNKFSQLKLVDLCLFIQHDKIVQAEHPQKHMESHLPCMYWDNFIKLDFFFSIIISSFHHFTFVSSALDDEQNEILLTVTLWERYESCGIMW